MAANVKMVKASAKKPATKIPKPVARVTEYVVGDLSREAYYSGFRHCNVTVALANPDKDEWAIRNDGECLTKAGSWIHERMPSGRTEIFMKRTRFTLEQALPLAEKAYLKLVKEFQRRYSQTRVLEGSK